LQIAARRINRNIRFGNDFETFFQFEANTRPITTEERRSNLACVVLQGEVRMPGPRNVKIADLAHDEDPPNLLFDQTRQPSQQLAHTQC
jgi:hypothetical protein